MNERRHGILSDLEKSDAYVPTDADYEEIPEVTDEMLDRAVFSRGEAALDRAVDLFAPKLWLDADVADGLKASGEDWRRLGNDVLRNWLRSRAA